jgi:hypothetical protein
MTRLERNEISGAESLVASYSIDLAGSQTRDYFPHSKSIIAVIRDSCIRCNRLEYVSDLMKKINLPIDLLGFNTNNENSFFNEIYPFIMECSSKKCMRHAFDTIVVAVQLGMTLSPKSISIVLQNFGKCKNDEMIDQFLLLISDRSFSVDLIVAHTAMDAYIRSVSSFY